MKYKIGDKVTLTNGNTMTIDQIDDISKWYRMREDPWNCYTDEMIEGLVEDKALKQYEVPTGSIKIWDLPDGYQFKDENGNVINATKIVLEKKKKEYPKTYKECCRIMDIDTGFLLTSYDLDFWKGHLLTSLQKLLICRDAYWKIAGDEMGLGKPWEPGDNKVFGIIRQHGKIQKYNDFVGGSTILEFPTEEMRDAFYENFKELIEQCKELL